MKDINYTEKPVTKMLIKPLITFIIFWDHDTLLDGSLDL
jgi:hypothetical protein